MSEFKQTFKVPLNKLSDNKVSALYRDNLILNPNQHSYRPQDVLSSVSYQLKAINNADSVKLMRRTAIDFQMYKKSTFLNVNKLSELVEEPPRQTTKFDTQCVTDTQLMNIIEDAENIDVHQGMTQEFETAFIQANTEKQDSENYTNCDKYVIEPITNTHISPEAIPRNPKDITPKNSVKKNLDLETHYVGDKNESLEYTSQGLNKTDNNSSDFIKNKDQNSVKLADNRKSCTETNKDIIENLNRENNEVEQLSQVLQTRVENFKRKKDKAVNFKQKCKNINENRIETEEISLLNTCREVKEDQYIERPRSPIFINKNVKVKSPSPLVFDLEQFEHFETLALSLLESHNLAKHVVDSQILNKEWHLNLNSGTECIDSNILSPIVTENFFVKDINKLDEVIAEKILREGQPSKQTNNTEIQNVAIKNVSNDEILFSSDEEYNYIHKNYQELPLTCALDTSFSKESDILDKTLYVGFQTASNKSIQVCAGSLTRAKTILSDVTVDEVTVTELVNSSKNSNNDLLENVKVYLNKEEKSIKLSNHISEQSQVQGSQVLPNNHIGFMTASNKDIFLSKQALARCRKVFQDIDLNENFDSRNVVQEIKTHIEDTNQNNNCFHVPDLLITKDGVHSVDTVLEGIDDEIIKEFENIEMSLEDCEDKPASLKASNPDNILISKVTVDAQRDTNIFQDISLLADSNENTSQEIAISKDLVLSQIIGSRKPTIRKSKMNVNSKAKSDKHINISDEVSSKSNNHKTNALEFPEHSKQVDGNEIFIDFVRLPINDTKFIGFKTANNRDIKISDKAFAQSIHIFKDIDSINCAETSKNINKVTLNETKHQDSLEVINTNLPSTSKGFLGFKTANNKHIKISEKAWNKTESIFSNIDSVQLPNKYYSNDWIQDNNHNSVIERENKLVQSVLETDDTDSKIEYSTERCGAKFVGFKSANNKNIRISNDALAKTKDIFKDIDEGDVKLAYKIKNAHPAIEEHDGTYKQYSSKNVWQSQGDHRYIVPKHGTLKMDSIHKLNTLPEVAVKSPFKAIKKSDGSNKRHEIGRDYFNDRSIECKSTSPLFEGFHTANNEPISISLKALEKSTNMILDERLINSDNILRNTELPGFKTASNKQVKISQKALANSRKIFENSDSPVKAVEKSTNNVLEKDSIDSDNSLRNTEFTGFQTASNKQVKISEMALAKSRRILEDLHSPVKALEKSTSIFLNKASSNSDNILQNTKFTGFQTASNKQVKISEMALAKSRKILEDLHSPVKALEKSTSMFLNKASSNSDNILPNSEFTGFQTASNKKVKISEMALAKSRRILEDLHSPVKALEKSTSMFLNKASSNSDNILQNTEFTGFQTASNKQVKISEMALAKSRKIFEDLDNHYCDLNDKDKSTKAKALYPNEILQENKINIAVANDVKTTARANTIDVFKGFKTASKKAVPVSKSALEKSKKLFEDCNELNPLTSELCRLENNEVVNCAPKAVAKNKKNNIDVSKGIPTASYKESNVSEGVFAKSKAIYHGIDILNAEVRNSKVKPSNINIGFPNGINQAIDVTEEVLTKSKRLFSEIDEESCKTRKKDKKTDGPEDIQIMLDTQVLNNFDQSLHTDDFIEANKNCKRPGSPILSCPRAKKRKKFETPYTTKNLPKPVMKEIEDNKALGSNKIYYKEDYKRQKVYTLKDIEDLTKNNISTIDLYLQNFSYENLLQFEFTHDRNDISSENITTDILKDFFLNSVNAKFVPNGWLDNHIQLILWKLISYEIKFKSAIVCTARNVLDQLKFRYDKELYNAQRSALRKIYEKDDVPSKTMVLCVVAIYVDGVVVPRITNTSSNIELLLTDGWYSIRCNIDRMLTNLVCGGKITVGCKLVTCGAELTGCEQGVAPWEDTSSVRLKIYGNSTRRARWDARLGYINHGPMTCQLSSVQVLGGKISKLRVFVTRVYPALYVEKFEDGSTVTRSERLENIHQMKTEMERQAFMEKLYEEVEKEFADQDSQDSGDLSDSGKRTCIDSGSQIAKMMKRSKDPGEFRAQLTASQCRLLETHTSKNRDRLLEDMQTRIRDRLEKAGSFANRNVVSLLKIRVAGVAEKGDNVEISKGMMSIWKPNDAIREVIKEGVWIDVLNVVPTAVRYSEIQISAGRQSVFSTSKYKEPDKFKPYTKLLHRQCYTIKDLAQNPSMSTDYNEIDTVGMIFLVDPPIKEFDSTKQSFQNVYLADAEKNIICVNFWGGLKKFGYQNVLDTGQVIACVNLQKRAGNTRKSIPQYRVTEFSYFTQTPKHELARKMLDDFNKKFVGLDRRKFCQDCVVIKNNYLLTKNSENISPYRFMNNDMNTPRNKVFLDSPLLRPNKIDDNFNLTGLDFESTFKQDSELSEEMLKRKKKVNEKIARLKMYGEPPPLSPIHIINRSKRACNSYKSPLLANNDNSSIVYNKSINVQTVNKNSILKAKDCEGTNSDGSVIVTSVENTPLKCGNNYQLSNSPVLLNRTYVKSVNPVKINFDVQENNDSKIDHFADEFEGSPPLSLD